MTWTTLQRSRLSEHLWGWTGGCGPQLILIHGVGMQADYWSNLVPALGQHFSLLVVDLPGHGRSPMLASDSTTLQDYSSCIAELVNSVNKPVCIAGHSMGATISVDLAHRFPDRVSAFVALNGVFQRDKLATKAVQERADSLDGFSTSDPSSTLRRWFDGASLGTNTTAIEHCREFLTGIDPLAYSQAYRAFAYDDGPSEATLCAIKCPALFATGGLEPNSTPAMSQAMASLTPLGICQVVKNARHMMSMTHGKEVTALMVSFFRQAGIMS